MQEGLLVFLQLSGGRIGRKGAHSGVEEGAAVGPPLRASLFPVHAVNDFLQVLARSHIQDVQRGFFRAVSG